MLLLSIFKIIGRSKRRSGFVYRKKKFSPTAQTSLCLLSQILFPASKQYNTQNLWDFTSAEKQIPEEKLFRGTRNRKGIVLFWQGLKQLKHHCSGEIKSADRRHKTIFLCAYPFILYSHIKRRCNQIISTFYLKNKTAAIKNLQTGEIYASSILIKVGRGPFI